MQLRSIDLIGYRNLVNVKLNFNSKINIFLGDNGHGKTNLLEAIYLTTLTKSFKTSKLTDLVRFNESVFYVKASIIKNDFLYLVNVGYDGKKQVSVNDNSNTKFKDVIGVLNAVLFVAEDLSLLKGSPKFRRRLLDIELSKLLPKYLVSLSSYYSILKQRNSLLKKSDIDEFILDSYNDQLVSYGLIIMETRKKFIVEIIDIIKKFYQMISETEDDIQIEYITNIEKEGNSFKTNLVKSFSRDLVLQQTNIGIHRDDFIVYLNGKNASLYASQGEQRTIILSLKLALVEYVYSQVKQYPILLLDDVMSELDIKRQHNLLRYLNDKVQTFITTTDLDSLQNDFCKDAKVFMVNDGLIKEEIVND